MLIYFNPHFAAIEARSTRTGSEGFGQVLWRCPLHRKTLNYVSSPVLYDSVAYVLTEDPNYIHRIALASGRRQVCRLVIDGAPAKELPGKLLPHAPPLLYNLPTIPAAKAGVTTVLVILTTEGVCVLPVRPLSESPEPALEGRFFRAVAAGSYQEFNWSKPAAVGSYIIATSQARPNALCLDMSNYPQDVYQEPVPLKALPSSFDWNSPCIGLPSPNGSASGSLCWYAADDRHAASKIVLFTPPGFTQTVDIPYTGNWFRKMESCLGPVTDGETLYFPAMNARGDSLGLTSCERGEDGVWRASVHELPAPGIAPLFSAVGRQELVCPGHSALHRLDIKRADLQLEDWGPYANAGTETPCCSRHHFRKTRIHPVFDSRGMFRTNEMRCLMRMSPQIMLAALLLQVAALTAVAQVAQPPVKRIIVTFDRSGSMENFPHDRLADYAARLIFDGIREQDLNARDKWAVRAGVQDSDFGAPLIGPRTALEVYQFGEKFEQLRLSSTSSQSLKSVAPSGRNCRGRTDIGTVVERACRYSEDNWEDGGRTLWIFVSDDNPTPFGAQGVQAKLLRDLELVYDWAPILTITVETHLSDPPVVQVREVSNRLYAQYRAAMQAIRIASSQEELSNIEAELKRLQEEIGRIFREAKHLPTNLVAEILERVKVLHEQATKELYRVKLGVFGLTHPGRTEQESRFVEGSPIKFDWTDPECEGVSHYTLLVRPAAGGPAAEHNATTSDSELADLTAGSYEWTVVAHGEWDIAATCSVTRVEGHWRPFRVAKPLGDFQLVDPAESATVPAGAVPFKWLPSENAEHYILEVASPAGETVTSQRNVCYATEPLAHAGQHTWRVKAVGPGGFPVAPSADRRLTVLPVVGAPELVAPRQA
ncbi:MAG: hypothetical protein O3A47_12985, partial [Chloroflexi bacterium]|nr:hypothetical protein [Chloroflexota bacterium]